MNMFCLWRVLVPLCLSLPTPALGQAAVASDTSIRRFRVHVSDEALTDLRRRINATRWPDKETVPDQSQGAQLAKLQPLVQYWGSGYDWRKAEAQLNAWPQFVTNRSEERRVGKECRSRWSPEQ